MQVMATIHAQRFERMAGKPPRSTRLQTCRLVSNLAGSIARGGSVERGSSFTLAPATCG